MDELTVLLAIAKAYAPGGLTPADCAKLSAEDAAEVSERLLADSRKLFFTAQPGWRRSGKP